MRCVLMIRKLVLLMDWDGGWYGNRAIGNENGAENEDDKWCGK